MPRLLPDDPITTLDAYAAAGGGEGLAAARTVGPDVVLGELEASGLRGRGGAGFPTATKWRTVAGYAQDERRPTVVVNGAEGEPGSFKDRAILRANPYAVVKGALVAAEVVGATSVVLALKDTFTTEQALLEQAVADVGAAGWGHGIDLTVVTGPSEYLFGEETGLLEVLDGRPPFPRLAPPFREGVDADVPVPTLANNVETVANVPGIVLHGAAWFREVGTERSPGTIVCTVSGATARHGVAEVPLGTPLGEVLERVGGGPLPKRRLVAALSGVANAVVPADLFHTPVTYEDMERIGSGLGAAGFIAFDDATDMAAVAAGVSRFLAVESCGQCTPCKEDGLALSETLVRITSSVANEYDLGALADRVTTVADEARCFLAHQHQRVLDSILRLFPDDLRRHLDPDAPAVDPEPILPIVDLDDEGRFVLDTAQLAKQPDWSHDAVWSGQKPVERLAEA